MEATKKIFRQTSIYSLGTIITLGSKFFLIPLWTRYLTPADYGILGTLGSISSLLSVFFISGLTLSIVKGYVKYDSNERKILLGNVFLLLLLSPLIISICLTIFGEYIFGFIGIPFYPYFILIIWAPLFMTGFALIMEIYRMREEPFKWLGFKLGAFVLTTILAIYLIVFRGEGALGRLEANFFANFIIFFVVLFLLKKFIILRFDKSKIKWALILALPIIPHAIFNYILSLSDRLILAYYWPLDEVGLYTIGYRFADVTNMVINSFILAWTPFFLKAVKDDYKGNMPTISKLITFWCAGITLVGLVVALFAKEIIMLMTTPDYYDSYTIVPIIVASYIFRGLYGFFNISLIYAEKTKLFPIVTGIAAVSNIGLNFYLIPIYGRFGAAFATLVAYIITFIFIYYLGQKYLYLKLEKGRIIGIFIAGTAIFFCSYIISEILTLPFLIDILIKGSFILVFLLVLLKTKLLDIRKIFQLMRKK